MLPVRFSIVIAVMSLSFLILSEVKSKVIFPNVPDIIDRDSLLPQDCRYRFYV